LDAVFFRRAAKLPQEIFLTDIHAAASRSALPASPSPAESREQLIHLLTEAAQLEHALLCSYLYAAFTLKRSEAEGVDAFELEAVTRWRKRIVGIATEEMGHLALVTNLLLAVGGAACFDRPNFPIAPGYLPSRFTVRLTPFDEATLEHFIFVERPEDSRARDAAEFAAEQPVERPREVDTVTPRTPDYQTIGGLYATIGTALDSLVRHRGAAAFADPTGNGQIGPDLLPLPGLRLVTDLASAKAALDTIVEQGEGGTAGHENCHFARFDSIKREWRLLAKRNPAFQPAVPAASDPVMREPAPGAERVWVCEPAAARLLDCANALYGVMLALLEQTCTPTGAAGPRAVFLQSAVGLMHAVAAAGTELARMPADNSRPGVNAGLTFTVPRLLRPRRPDLAADMFVERLLELESACATGAESLIPHIADARGRLQRVQL
jgi:hypothetical protein